MALNNLTKVQTLGIGSNIEVVGVITTGQFKSGTSNLHSTGVELTNLNVSGIATIGGNLSIGGTLTYQDVTNIDSVGLITARNGINVSGGNVTIANDLDVTGNITAAGEIKTLTLFESTSGNDLRLNAGSANRDIFLQVNDTTLMTVRGSTGKIGIGTADPTGTLEILDTSEYQLILKDSNNAGPGAEMAMGFKDSANTIQGIIGFNHWGDDEFHIINQNNGGEITFKTHNGSAVGERVRITSGGMVLIGETSVAGGSQKLVIGNGGAENFEFTPATSAQNGGVLEYIHRGDGSTRPDLSMYVGGGAFKVYTGGNNERLRVGTSGEIGLGGANYGTSGQVLTSQGSGSAVQWASVSASGTVIQTIKKPLSSNFSTSSSSFQDVTGLTQAITLSNSSNKVLIVAVLGINGYGDRDRRCVTGLFHTNMNTSNQFNEIYSGEYHTGDSGSYSYGCHTHYVVDTPGSTSRTYKIGLKNMDGSTARVYGQTNSGTTDLSYILLQEITA